MSTTMLTLDGEPIALQSMRITAGMQFMDADQSGQTSATSTSEQGAKAKELDVTGLIAFKDEAHLARLFELADAKGDGGQRHLYRVGSLLAKSIKVRQAKFAGRISATEQEGLLAWHIQFTLREHNSVPEQREQRKALPPPTVGQGTDNTSSTGAAGTTTESGAPDLTTFEKFVLKPMDDFFA
ncbi:hypothetical protein [Aeromonas sp. R10-1]|uniref:baseplate complex protein n=1 Tax=Aeromonas sp. R10-1 TaxID=3138457 RepID=UPI0034A33701